MATTIKSKVFTSLNDINDYLQCSPNIQPMGIQSFISNYRFYYRESESIHHPIVRTLPHLSMIKELESRIQDLEVANQDLETKLSNSRALNNRIHSHYRNQITKQLNRIRKSNA